MQMRVETLRETLNLLKPVVPGKKAVLPVTRYVLLKDGKAVATDLETMVILDVPEVEGECLIPHHEVSELLKHVPGYEELSIEVKGRSLFLTWDGGSASYEAMDTDKYPPLVEGKAETEAALPGDSLVGALSSAVGYCATEEKRPVLCGVHLFLGEQVRVAAANGFRMAHQTLPMSYPVEATAIIPTRSVKVLAHLWEKLPPAPPPVGSLVGQVTAKRQLRLAVKEDRLRAAFGRVVVVARLIEGTPPDYRRLIPDEVSQEVRFFAPDLERAVRRLKEIARDSSGAVKLSWTENTLTATARSEEKGEVTAEVPAQTDGTAGRIAINVGHLLDYLKGREGIVTMGVRGAQEAVLFHHGTSPLVLIMPMVVQW